jgi:hypothetical protein
MVISFERGQGETREFCRERPPRRSVELMVISFERGQGETREFCRERPPRHSVELMVISFERGQGETREFCRERPPRRSVELKKGVDSQFAERRGGRSLHGIDDMRLNGIITSELSRLTPIRVAIATEAETESDAAVKQ